MGATEQFRRAGLEISWGAMVADTSLQTSLPLESPRPGSVWEQVLTRLAKAHPGNVSVAALPVGEFVNEAVQIRCWRRDQKSSIAKCWKALQQVSHFTS